MSPKSAEQALLTKPLREFSELGNKGENSEYQKIGQPAQSGLFLTFILECREKARIVPTVFYKTFEHGYFDR
jgi:hypothetical protein